MSNIKRWAQDYDCCVECGETKRRHLGHGICQLCWQRDKASNRKRQLPPRVPIAFNDAQMAMLLFAETKEKYGYEIESLSYGTPRKVVHKCDVCGQPKETPFREFMLAQKTAHFKCKTQKAQKTNLKKYGVKHPCQSVEIQQKIQQTFLRNYGVPNSQLSPEVRKKKEETNLQRYGVRNPLESFRIRQKTSQSLQEHYGVEHPGCSSVIQERIRQSTFKKYGVEHPGQSPEIRSRIQQTIINRYGVEYPAQSPEIHQKMKQTTLERFGVEFHVQLPEYRGRLRQWTIAHPKQRFTSKSELQILNWIQQYYPIAHKHQEHGYEIDIFIPDISLGIEYNGLFWHQENILGKDYHINKTNHFKSKGIHIIHIFEHEWRNKQEQVKSFLLSAIGKTQHQIDISKCNVVWSSTEQDIQEVHKFLENYYIQGQPINTKYVIKALYNNEIVVAATLGCFSGQYVLTCFHTIGKFFISNILSEISKIASQNLNSDLWSEVDHRLSNGSEYEGAGWTLENTLSPRCFYVNRYVVSLNPLPNHKNNYKIWDCGTLLYKYTYKNR